ncbi:acyltransferase domain-containing protein [Dactylosporangium roseum]|uniref:Acyltransferase domain-containing protein n=1 Tax=Dactylosporangium roseum TaxID=47989 RepID=A0ABY5ZB94_9ACTN|nr:acyltransferase domain-containing protein [Dactylosporangium roseum]UWZ39365.1 acyltransferase domain-containing protein [Dactylosporangium roseum]
MVQPRSVLLLPGQGAQRERMAAGLYHVDPVFSAEVERLLAALGPAGRRLREQWLRPAPHPGLDDSETAQPLLLIVGYALGRALAAASRMPNILLGHSMGELAAACLAGVYPPTAVTRLVHGRTRGLSHVGRGGMLAVAARPEQLDGMLIDGVVVAAVNGPRQTVLAGSRGALVATAGRLSAAGFSTLPLRSWHAFHSPAMAPVAARFRGGLSRLPAAVPEVRIYSSRTAAEVRRDEAVDPGFWADQMMLPVQYWTALRALLDTEGTTTGLLLVDASVDRSLSAPARHHPAVRAGTSRIVPLLGTARETGGPADVREFAAAAAALRGSA